MLKRLAEIEPRLDAAVDLRNEFVHASWRDEHAKGRYPVLRKRIPRDTGQEQITTVSPEGSVLRAETTINDPGGFKVYRTAEGDDAGQPSWRAMRKGVADMTRRTEVSQTRPGRSAGAPAIAVAAELGGDGRPESGGALEPAYLSCSSRMRSTFTPVGAR